MFVRRRFQMSFTKHGLSTCAIRSLLRIKSATIIIIVVIIFIVLLLVIFFLVLIFVVLIEHGHVSGWSSAPLLSNEPSHLVGIICSLSDTSTATRFLALIVVVIVDGLVDGLHCERSQLLLQQLLVAVRLEQSDHLTNLLRKPTASLLRNTTAGLGGPGYRLGYLVVSGDGEAKGGRFQVRQVHRLDNAEESILHGSPVILQWQWVETQLAIRSSTTNSSSYDSEEKSTHTSSASSSKSSS